MSTTPEPLRDEHIRVCDPEHKRVCDPEHKRVCDPLTSKTGL